MQFYTSPEAEAFAIRRAVARVSGCRVRSLAVVARRRDGGGDVIGSIVCLDGWGAAKLLLALAEEDAKTPGARRLAAELRARAPSDAAFAREVHAYVLARVRFAREKGEVFQSSAYTLTHGIGDCDDHARPVYALAVAGGLPARLGFLHHGFDAPPLLRGPAHVATLLCPRDSDVACEWAETTIAASYGENPNAAARRLGVTNERSDIASEVVIMSNEDLPPVPWRYRERNDPAQVELDAEALQRLGYLCATTNDPTDIVLRRAVLEFQKARGLRSLDGLLGDHETRPAIAAALAEAGIGDLVYPLHMGSLADVKPAAPLFTHAAAREALRGAYVAQFGREPTKGELDFGLATAYFETFYGRGGPGGAPWANRGQFGRWARDGKYNWGALEGGAKGNARMNALLDAAGIPYTLERGTDGGNPTFFYLFRSDEDAARAFLMAWGAKDTLAAAAAGDAFGVAAAMRGHGYYTGFHVGPGKMTPALEDANRRMGYRAWQEEATDAEALRKNIAEYGAGLARTVKVVTGPGGVDDPAKGGASGGGGGGFAVALGVLALVGAGALAWWKFA